MFPEENRTRNLIWGFLILAAGVVGFAVSPADQAAFLLYWVLAVVLIFAVRWAFFTRAHREE